MAVWDLNSNLDVFSMQTFLRGLIYVSHSKAYITILSGNVGGTLQVQKDLLTKQDGRLIIILDQSMKLIKEQFT
jgi:hypothetical protein